MTVSANLAFPPSLYNRQVEVDADKKARELSGESLLAEESFNPLSLLPFNTSWVGNLVPAGATKEFGECWSQLDAFVEAQWEPALAEARKSVQASLDERDAASPTSPGLSTTTTVQLLPEQLSRLAPMAWTEIDAAYSKASAELEALAANRKRNGDASTQTKQALLQMRREMAVWTAEGPLSRSVLTSLLFTFVMIKQGSGKYINFPKPSKELGNSPPLNLD